VNRKTLFLIFLSIIPLVFIRELRDPFILPKSIFVYGFLLFLFISTKKSCALPCKTKLLIFLYLSIGFINIINLYLFLFYKRNYTDFFFMFNLVSILLIISLNEFYRKIKLISIFRALAWAGSIGSLILILQKFKLIKGLWVPSTRVALTSTFGNPNYIAAFLVLTLPLAIELFYSSYKSDRLHLFFIITGLSITKSRAALISLILAFILTSKLKKSKKIVIFTISILLISSLFTGTCKRFLNKDIQQRLLIYLCALKIATKQNILIGGGTKAFKNNFLSAQNEILSTYPELKPYRCIAVQAHNEFLEILCSFGILGLLMFILLIFYFLNCIYSSGLKEAPSLLNSIIAILIFSLFHFPFHRIEILVPVFVFVGYVGLANTPLKSTNSSTLLNKTIIFVLLIIPFIYSIIYIKTSFYLQEAYNAIRHKNYARAQKILSYTLNLDPLNEKLLFALAYTALRAQNFSLSLATFWMIDNFYIDPAIPYNIGLAYLSLRYYTRAIYFFKKAIELYPEYLPALNNLGVCYIKQKNFAKAKAFYIQCIKAGLKSKGIIENLKKLSYITSKN